MKADELDAPKDALIRFFKAFADIAIISALKNQPMTGYGIKKHFMNRIGDIASPSTIYTHLVLLERKRLIECIKNKRGRLYALTATGRKIADNMPNIVEEINRSLNKILEI